MGARKVKTIEYKCDNPECGDTFYSNPDLADEPVAGVTIRMAVIAAGGDIVEGWACSTICSPKAVDHLLNGERS